MLVKMQMNSRLQTQIDFCNFYEHTKNMICFIVPPHILEEIKNNGSDTQKAWAEKTIAMSDQIRQKREMMPAGILGGSEVIGGNKNRIIYTANNTLDLPGTEIMQEGNPPVNDTAANQAYNGTGATYDLYFNIYQRNSIDNKGMNLISTVHYSQQYDNAFWDGSQMVYGDGDGELFGLFTKPIDVTGHELTHGVTQYTANLAYQDESGALNESFSDVFGTLVKQQSLNQTADQADWLIGEGIFTSQVHGQALRNMKAPGTAYDDPVLGKDPQPADMAHFVNSSFDNGGVHINSGIPNHAFYLAATGIGGNAWERAVKIWYVTLTQKLQANASFADCATSTFDVAGELFGAGGSEQKAVEEAWKQVGVI